VFQRGFFETKEEKCARFSCERTRVAFEAVRGKFPGSSATAGAGQTGSKERFAVRRCGHSGNRERVDAGRTKAEPRCDLLSGKAKEIESPDSVWTQDKIP